MLNDNKTSFCINILKMIKILWFYERIKFVFKNKYYKILYEALLKECQPLGLVNLFEFLKV